MPKMNAFISPAYPVLFSVSSGVEASVPPAEAELALALLVGGLPSFLATHRVPEETIDDVVVSLQEGDPRIAVSGTWVASPGERHDGAEKRAAAFVTLVCTDGRRITIARVLGEDPDAAPDLLARRVIRQIVRGVQVPDLVGG